MITHIISARHQLSAEHTVRHGFSVSPPSVYSVNKFQWLSDIPLLVLVTSPGGQRSPECGKVMDLQSGGQNMRR